MIRTLLLHHEAGLRFAVFACVLALMAVAETLAPERRRHFARTSRWPANLVLVASGTAVLRLAFPLLAAGVGAWAARAHFGLLQSVAAPYWAAFAVGLVLLDVTIYAQHVAMHRIPILWRLHRVHHTDRDVDTSTALRFHPGEIALSMGLKMAVVALLGVPTASVIVFEMGLNGMAMFNHANLRMAPVLERVLRALVVTPAMHRIHHSALRAETDSNYGFTLSLWDRLFGTYRRCAREPDFMLGLEHFQDARPNGLGFVLANPFARGASR